MQDTTFKRVLIFCSEYNLFILSDANRSNKEIMPTVKKLTVFTYFYQILIITSFQVTIPI